MVIGRPGQILPIRRRNSSLEAFAGPAGPGSAPVCRGVGCAGGGIDDDAVRIDMFQQQHRGFPEKGVPSMTGIHIHQVPPFVSRAAIGPVDMPFVL